MKEQVRIIAGKYRGKKLSFPAIDDLRPTASRVKETLFNWLMSHIRGARCLDAFAGSGSLGFEALSRGAKDVVMVESSQAAFASLQHNLLSFPEASCQILQSDALSYLKLQKEPFDLIFLDPPFRETILEECLHLSSTGSCLRKGGLVYVESPKALEVDPDRWELRKSKKAGQVYFALLEKV